MTDINSVIRDLLLVLMGILGGMWTIMVLIGAVVGNTKLRE